MIKLQVIGNLGKDAVVNNVNGKTVINFTVAHTEKYRDAQGQQVDKTTWVDCSYWTDKTAIAPYLKKGSQVFVEGVPDVRTYTTQDGRNGASLILRILSPIQLLGSKNEDGSSNGSNNYQSTPQPQPQYQQSYNTPPTNMQPAPMQPSSLVEPLDDLPF